MEIKLTFKIELVNGEETEQEISVPADPNHPVDTQTLLVMQSMFRQYATVGLLREPTKGTFVLMLPSQIRFIECTVPSIVIAGAQDVPKITLI